MLSLFFTFDFLHAQQANVPLNYNWIQESEARSVMERGFALSSRLNDYEADRAVAAAMSPDTATFNKPVIVAAWPYQTSMRPWIEQGHPLRKDVVLQNAHDKYASRGQDMPEPGWLKKYHYRNSLLQVERGAQNGEPQFQLYIDPLLNLEYMSASGDTTAKMYYVNTRGVRAYGNIGTKISFETSFWENQAFLPNYLSNFASGTGVIPGQGRWKPVTPDSSRPNFGKPGYDFAYVSGYISWSPCRFFNFQAGHGKFFVGDGYRSLLLSDNSFNYPFARFTGWFGPDKMFQYTAIYASLMNLTPGNVITPPGTERLFQKKSASFYQLAAKIGRVGEVSLFQGLIWKAADDRNKQCLTLAYFDPVIFSAIPAVGMNAKNNFLIGGTMRFDLLRTLRLYGQWMIDDVGKKGTFRHKAGFQLGLKYFNAFTLKHLHLELEYNRVSPYSYAASDSAQSYTHYNQPLAHPLGANFSEIVFSMQYKIGDFFLHFRYETATLGVDSAKFNFGQDVFISDVNPFYAQLTGPVKFGQGLKTTVNYMDLSAGYMISYASNLNISVGYIARNVDPGATFDNSNYVYVALRTSLENTYRDFYRK